MKITLIADSSEENPIDCDWVGNNAAFTCPLCSRVFIVSGLIHQGKRLCPSCEKTTGHVTGGRNSGGEAFIEWDQANLPFVKHPED